MLANRHTRERGYSAVEMMVVMVVLGIGLTLAAPLTTNLLAGDDSDRAARQVADDLKRARMRALSQQQATTITFFADHTYVIAPPGLQSELPAGTTFDSVAPLALTFDASGLLTAPGTVALDLGGHDHDFQVTITPVGHIAVAEVAP